jgi:hypothetical protein
MHAAVSQSPLDAAACRSKRTVCAKGEQMQTLQVPILMAPILRLASLVGLFLIALTAFAQPAPPTLFTASVAVVPEVAPPGVARSLIVNGVWPNGCIPKSATLRLQDVGPRQFVVIVLQRPPDSVCTWQPSALVLRFRTRQRFRGCSRSLSKRMMAPRVAKAVFQR